ncbi:Uma2 family endonuclease [Actinorugispora endophytica]|uniref:Putative restriction endonuclease n=1 Tax=Actinorugispora endophytica TaxID=1605990 RepID=A0A4R6UZN9_9ACTN|nr:Uma2 family endonuclease [Actinorugispora endophytica]TDQ51609.1 putative restriction endonuclease [Actinorugispora endophytica]
MSVTTTGTKTAAMSGRQPLDPWPSETLRDVAERMTEVLPGYRIEILGGKLVVSPTPTAKHNGIIRLLQLQLDSQLPAGKVPLQTTSIEGPGPDQDYCTPDLLALPAEVTDEDDWLFSADIVDKLREYAEWGIPLYLLVDPRDGAVVVYSDPSRREYRGVHRMTFGDSVVLPEPLRDVKLDSSGFRRYGEKEKRTGARREKKP